MQDLPYLKGTLSIMCDNDADHFSFLKYKIGVGNLEHLHNSHNNRTEPLCNLAPAHLET